MTDSMLCAHSNAGRDACQGDSGGPLVLSGGIDSSVWVDEKGGKWMKDMHEITRKFPDVVVGIVSWGSDCGHPRYPGVYSQVSVGCSWIEQPICGDLSPKSCRNGKLRDFSTERVKSSARGNGSKGPRHI